MRIILPLLLLGACTAEPAPQYGVATSLLISRADDDGVSRGFNLDGQDSPEDGTTGCGIGDYINELGEGGVDNAIARLVPILEQTEAIAAEALIQQAINSGELLIIFEMVGVEDDLLNAEQVGLRVLRGMGAPIVGTDGLLVSGQTFDVDTNVSPIGQEALTLTNGQVTAQGLTLEIPITIFDANLEAVLEAASVRIFWNDDGSFTGYMGGSLDYWSIIEMAIDSNVDQALAESLPLLFGANADLKPDANGQCSRISFTFTFEGVSAFLYEDSAY